MDFLRQNQMEGSGSPEEAEILVYPGEWLRQEIRVESGRRGHLAWVYNEGGIEVSEKGTCRHYPAPVSSQWLPGSCFIYC